MKKKKFETLAVQTRTPQTPEKENSAPLFLTSGFTFDTAEDTLTVTPLRPPARQPTFAQITRWFRQSRLPSPVITRSIRPPRSDCSA